MKYFLFTFGLMASLYCAAQQQPDPPLDKPFSIELDAAAKSMESARFSRTISLSLGLASAAVMGYALTQNDSDFYGPGLALGAASITVNFTALYHDRKATKALRRAARKYP